MYYRMGREVLEEEGEKVLQEGEKILELGGRSPLGNKFVTIPTHRNRALPPGGGGLCSATIKAPRPEMGLSLLHAEAPRRGGAKFSKILQILPLLRHP